jgi:DNA-binding MarR family transcriptional regulator
MLKARLKEAGAEQIKPAYLGLLWCLWIQDGVKTNVLGKCAGLEPSSMTGVLDRMERDGLVTREADPEDRRVQRVFLTNEGGKVKEAVVWVMDETTEIMFAGFTRRGIAQTKGFLRRMLLNLQGEGKE